VGQVMFKSLIEAKNQFEVLKIFKKNIVKNFGPGSKYWKNLNLRKKYKKIKWTKPMTGPWIHQNIMETIKNIKSKKNITGGKKVNESDGFCAVLPYYLYDQNISNVKKVIKSVANTKISEQYALAKLEIIKLAADNTKDPVRSFVKKNNSNKYFKDVVLNLKKIIRDAKKPHISTVKKYGKACSYPGTFLGSIHAILNSKNYKSAVIKLIKAGGCNCSRANFVGAYFAALNGLKDIPVNWIKKTIPAKKILRQL
jgi:ADP-ribosylglycohydrolase